MNTSFLRQARLATVCVCSFFIILLFSACSGVINGTGANGGTIVGSIQSVNKANHSVNVNVNGQTVTVNNLTDTQITTLQSQVGKTYSFQVQGTQGTTNNYSVSDNTDPTETDNATSTINVAQPTEAPNDATTSNTSESISFIGKVIQANANSLTVTMPNRQTLSMIIVNGQSDLTDFNGKLPAINTVIKVEANATTNGSFTLTKLGATDASDTQDTAKMNTIDLQGVTTQTVGSDYVVHIKVGSKNFSSTLNTNSELKNFANTQEIPNNQLIKASLLYNGSNGTILTLENNSSNG